MEEVVQEVQKAATVADIVHDHIHGLSGYQIAEKYGLDTEKVKQIIREADEREAFVPKPLVEGENPEAEVATT